MRKSKKIGTKLYPKRGIGTMNTINTIKQKQHLEPVNDMSKAINAYLTGSVGKYGQYFALPNALVHRRVLNDYSKGQADLHQSILAMDINGVKIGNSSILPMLGAKVSWGTLIENRSVVPIQTELSKFIPMVPFTVFDEANLDIRQLKIVDKGDEEEFIVKVRNPKYTYASDPNMVNVLEFLEENRHFTGACLFECENKFFLFDIDRREIKHKIFNAFLVEVPMRVSSIREAYEALKPSEVKEAESQGLKVKRQGEWFFIPVKGQYTQDTEVEQWGDKLGTLVNRPLELRAGQNRPNVASMGIESKQLVRGSIKHSGREHADLMLVSWHKAVPNTAIKSFTITGSID